MFIMSVVLFLSRRWFEKCHLLKYKTLFFLSPCMSLFLSLNKYLTLLLTKPFFLSTVLRSDYMKTKCLMSRSDIFVVLTLKLNIVLYKFTSLDFYFLIFYLIDCLLSVTVCTAASRPTVCGSLTRTQSNKTSLLNCRDLQLLVWPLEGAPS